MNLLMKKKQLYTLRCPLRFIARKFGVILSNAHNFLIPLVLGYFVGYGHWTFYLALAVAVMSVVSAVYKEW